MAEEANNASQSQDAGEPHGEQSTDWEAKYREAVSHSREWEKRAKDNKAAADELEKLKEASMSEQEKAARHVKELEAKVASYEAAKQRAEWKAQVSAETGVPADVLEGDSLEAMQAHAKAISEYVASRTGRAACAQQPDREREIAG